jgi:hypothetical protein
MQRESFFKKSQSHRSLSIEEVAQRFNATPRSKGYVALCPAHDDHHPSLSIDPGDKQPIVIKCMSHNCDLEAILAPVGLTPKDICNGNGNGNGYRQCMSAMSRVHPHEKIEPVEIPAFDWSEARENATDERLAKIAKWRGYKFETVQYLRDQNLIGVMDKQVAFPVHDDIGWIVGAHVRQKDGSSWFYKPTGISTAPLILTTETDSHFWVIAESQWDGIAFGELSGQWEIIVTRGASNGKLVKDLVPPNSTVLLLTQNDPLDKDGSSSAVRWEQSVLSHLDPSCQASRVSIPAQHGDLNDLLKTGCTSQQLLEASI